VATVKKTPSEIYHEIESIESDLETGVVTVNILIRNPYCAKGSLGVFQYMKDGDLSYSDCTLAETQEIDINSIELNGRAQQIALKWDAATDIGIQQKYENVSIRVAFYDEENQAGDMSDYAISTADIDFSIGAVEKITKPKFNDPYMDFEFYSPATIRPSRVHFKLEIATDEGFNNVVASFDTSISQAEWSFNDESFPAAGIPGHLEWKITCSDASLPALSNGDYYYRIVPTATDPDLEAFYILDADGNYLLDENYNYVVTS